MFGLNRRELLVSTTLMGAGYALPASLVQPAAPATGKQVASFYRYRVGDYEVTAINDGIWLPPIDEKFVRNAAFTDVQNALAAAFQPTDKLPIPFTSLVVNTGTKLVMIDTGTGGQYAPIAPQSAVPGTPTSRPPDLMRERSIQF